MENPISVRLCPWDQLNDKYPSFVAEEKNLSLGLSTDEFNPFNMNINYSAGMFC